MPPDFRSSKQTFDISLVDVGVLDSPGGLKIALHAIESVCFQADPTIAGMVMTLSSRSHVLEYIFSSTLRVSVAAYQFPGSIVFFPSVRRAGIREVVRLDHFRLPDTHHPKRDR